MSTTTLHHHFLIHFFHWMKKKKIREKMQLLIRQAVFCWDVTAASPAPTPAQAPRIPFSGPCDGSRQLIRSFTFFPRNHSRFFFFLLLLLSGVAVSLRRCQVVVIAAGGWAQTSRSLLRSVLSKYCHLIFKVVSILQRRLCLDVRAGEPCVEGFSMLP